ncbi:HNH endonuclease [Poseidonibacter lekithochrous]|uniref:HNH endonuclease n=1 Tax=Poseidonibacter TaxID=2321187 RepID=UPI001C08984B|nr:MULTISPECIES: HNH endonuclease [Poseidonibacter]MBU3015871.1 HNH endonuclease [Poseidonibacter lekithochrous]MDO6829170.1 HNH endonuclease [Poseidonibacter sp. 1_MG-2023]
MILDSTFIIYSSLIIACLIPLYIYRQKVFSFAYKTGSLEFFIKDLKQHMQRNHPKISLDYSIIEKTKDEKDIRIRETLIVEDIISQFFYHEYEKNTQKGISREKLWSTYEEKSFSNPKTPNDWIERRELAWIRDENKCNRCGMEIKLDDTFTTFAKDIAQGGGYNFENIIILCSDCNKVLNDKNPKNTIASLNLNDALIKYVEG